MSQNTLSQITKLIITFEVAKYKFRDFMQKFRESFAVSELGSIYAQLPLKEPTEKTRSHFPSGTI